MRYKFNSKYTHQRTKTEEYKISSSVLENLMIGANHVAGLFATERGRGVPFRTMNGELRPTFAAMHSRPVLGAEWASLRHELGVASVSAAAEVHKLVGVQPYCHFTSPIRRISDLLAHHQVRAALKGEPSPFSDGYLSDFCKRFNAIQNSFLTGILSNDFLKHFIFFESLCILAI